MKYDDQRDIPRDEEPVNPYRRINDMDPNVQEALIARYVDGLELARQFPRTPMKGTA